MRQHRRWSSPAGRGSCSERAVSCRGFADDDGDRAFFGGGWRGCGVPGVESQWQFVAGSGGAYPADVPGPVELVPGGGWPEGWFAGGAFCGEGGGRGWPVAVEPRPVHVADPTGRPGPASSTSDTVQKLTPNDLTTKRSSIWAGRRYGLSGLSAAHKRQSESGRAVAFDHRHIVEMRIVVRCSVW